MNRRLTVLMSTAFVDMIGTVMIVPLLPFYAERIGASALLVGVLVSIFSVAQLASAPIWGRISDRGGRRPVILGGLLLSAVAYVVFGFATSFWLLLISRVFQGFGGGTVGVIQAYVADESHSEDRAKSLGWLSAATSLGAVVGPALGSWLAAIGGQRAPGIAAAVICILNLAFAWRYLEEAQEMATRTSHPIQSVIDGAGTKGEVWRTLAHPTNPAARLVWTYTVAIGAFYGMLAVFTMSLERRLGITEKTIFWFFMWFGASGVVFRFFVLGPAIKRFGEARLSRIGLMLLAAGTLLFPVSPRLPVIFLAITLMPLGTAMTFPCTTAMLSRVVPSNARGFWLGVQQTMGGAARVVFPLYDGWVFDHLGIGWPFWTGGVLTLLSILLIANIERLMPARPIAAPTPATGMPARSPHSYAAAPPPPSPLPPRAP